MSHSHSHSHSISDGLPSENTCLRKYVFSYCAKRTHVELVRPQVERRDVAFLKSENENPITPDWIEAKLSSRPTAEAVSELNSSIERVSHLHDLEVHPPVVFFSLG